MMVLSWKVAVRRSFLVAASSAAARATRPLPANGGYGYESAFDIYKNADNVRLRPGAPGLFDLGAAATASGCEQICVAQLGLSGEPTLIWALV